MKIHPKDLDALCDAIAAAQSSLSAPNGLKIVVAPTDRGVLRRVALALLTLVQQEAVTCTDTVSLHGLPLSVVEGLH